MSLLVIGSAAFDTITTPHGSVEEVLGGSAVYTAVAASYLTPVKMVAVVGEDFGEEALQLLRDRGIDVSAVEVSRGRTFRWACRYSEDLSERKTLRTELNVFDSFRPKLGRKDVGAPYLFLASIDPGIQRAALTRVRPGVAACDTMDFWIDTKSGDLKRLLGAVDGLVINDAEARLLAGELNSVAAARRLLGLGLRFLVVKRGEYGAALFCGKHYFAVPAYPVERPRDPTGAGDSFAGGFMGHVARSKDSGEGTLREAMLYGSVLASFCVEDFSLRRLVSIDRGAIASRCQELRGFLSMDEPPPRPPRPRRRGRRRP